tara:strand:+ start:557 stop:754 length:198 start_codon:yes stop_codon:yes gene_type:complete
MKSRKISTNYNLSSTKMNAVQKGSKDKVPVNKIVLNKTIETVKLDLGGSRSPNCGVVPSKYIVPN